MLERLLEGSEVALTNKFIDSRRLQYANTELLDKIFFDQQGKVNRVRGGGGGGGPGRGVEGGGWC